MTQITIITGARLSGKTTLARNLASCYPESEISIIYGINMKSAFPFHVMNPRAKVLIVDDVYNTDQLTEVYNLATGSGYIQKPSSIPVKTNLEKIIVVLDNEKLLSDIILRRAKLYDTSKIISPCQSSTTK